MQHHVTPILQYDLRLLLSSTAFYLEAKEIPLFLSRLFLSATPAFIVTAFIVSAFIVIVFSMSTTTTSTDVRLICL